jgi:hypothetical protein
MTEKNFVLSKTVIYVLKTLQRTFRFPSLTAQQRTLQTRNFLIFPIFGGSKTTKLILLDSLLQEIKSWGAQLKQRQNENTA